MNKRGLSPLMATFLLIAFAVAVGVLIMNFSRAHLEKEAQCGIEIGLHFSEINNEKQVCLDKNKKELFFIIENGPALKVEGLIVDYIGKEKTKTFEIINSSMEKVASLMKRIPYSTEEFGQPRQIKFIPKIKLYQEETLCPEQALIAEHILECQT